MLRVILHSEEIQKHRFIAAHIIRQTADRFQNNFLQHYVADVVDFARSASEIVVGAAIKFLIGFQAFRHTEMKFCAAVRAVKQTCKQALPAGFGVPALVTAELLHTLKFLLRDDWLLHIRDNLLLLDQIVNHLMNLVADRCAFEIYRATGVLPVG